VATVREMLLELKLRRVGNSVGVILPKEALAHLKVDEGDTVSVTEAADGSLRLSPSKAEVVRQMEVVQDVMNRYRHTLRELAK
jgi:putative addiction module antidote